MKINILLKSIGNYSNLAVHDVVDITRKLEEVRLNSLYVLIKYSEEDLKTAILKGAKTIITEVEIKDKFDNVNIILVDHCKIAYQKLLSKFYNNRINKMKIIGVTGTNGKTTVTTLLHEFFGYKQLKSIFIGTGEIKYDNFIYDNKNTTPDIKEIYYHLNEAYKLGVRYCFMEVSSISIEELRVHNIPFHAVILTNFSQDHLDYHLNLDNYLNAKCRLFSGLKKNKYLIINRDEPKYKRFMEYGVGKIITYGIDNPSDFKASDINYTYYKMDFKINGEEISSFLIGKFNVYNILAVMAAIKSLGFKNTDFINFLKYYHHVDGRLNFIPLKDKLVVIDYAHTPFALESLLKTLKLLNHHEIISVIGCGGNRDKDKRSKIGHVLTNLSDKIILTNDNPRFEDPNMIIDDIKKGIDKEVEVILDRKKAIEYAINNSTENDIIAIIGKGKEKSQNIEGLLIPYSDYDTLIEIIEEHSC